MLGLPQFKDRLRAYVMVEGATKGITEYREEAVLPLQTVAATGAMARRDIIQFGICMSDTEGSRTWIDVKNEVELAGVRQMLNS